MSVTQGEELKRDIESGKAVSARIRPIEGVAPAKAGTLSVALGGQGVAGERFLQPFPYYCGRDVTPTTSF